MSDPIVRQRFAMHMKLQGGSIYAYDLLDEAGTVIGAYSKTRKTVRGETKITLKYLLGSGPDAIEYETPLAFMEAYKQLLKEKLADDEWNAAAPPEKKTDV